MEPLPYIVIVIDELADLMMAAHEVNYIAVWPRWPCARYPPIVATQRPSVDVITGTIKANIRGSVFRSVPRLIRSYWTPVETPWKRRYAFIRRFQQAAPCQGLI